MKSSLILQILGSALQIVKAQDWLGAKKISSVINQIQKNDQS